MESVFNPGDYFAPLTVGPSFRPVLMLGQLVQTTTAKWITQAPSRCTTTIGGNTMTAQSTEGRLRVPGATLYYKTQGAGPVLLILQGGAGDADDYRKIRLRD